MSKKNALTPPTMSETWCGACLDFPGYILEDGPRRPKLVVWLDVTHDLVVGHHLLDPGQPTTLLADVLVSATQHPMEGPARIPQHVRVASKRDAQNVRSRMGDAVHISIDPLPEMDAFLATMQQHIQSTDDPDDAMVVDHHIDTEVLRRFHEASALLWKAAPWRLLDESDLLQLHCPKLNAKNWVVSVIGALGESFGIMLFPTLTAFDAFRRHAQTAQFGMQKDRLPTSLFVLNYDRGADVPKEVRANVSKHKLPVADANAYPSVVRPDPDFTLRPLVEDDYQLATLCAELMTSFFLEHKDAIKKGTFAGDVHKKKLTHLKGNASISLTGPHPKRDWM